MTFTVYMILSKVNKKYITYVGYTNNLKNRLILHNKSKGAKFTKGKYWKLIYYKNFKGKSEAMKEEFKLKKNFKLRNKIKNNYIKNLLS